MPAREDYVNVGLATRGMCEGIGPAVRSGLLAARSNSQREASTMLNYAAPES